MRREIEQILIKQGYRFCKELQNGIYYKYYKEGFHIVMLTDLSHGYIMTPPMHKEMEEQIMDLFYHPQGRLMDFPDGFPVYHVEVLTLLVGGDMEIVRRLCKERGNIWYCQPTTGQLIIYENQPGDFWGLRDDLESAYADKINKTRTTIPLKKNIKTINNLFFVTIAISAANVIVYIILEMLGDTQNGLFIAEHGGMYPEFIRYNQQWWRIFTAMFIHFGMAHLVNNMVIFCLIGSRLERAVGHWKMFLIYLTAGIGGGLLSYVMMLVSGDYAVSAGASGAVFGTIGGLLWVVIWNRGKFEGLTTKGLVLMSALSLYYGFSTIGVDNWSHIGGIIAGFIAAAILYHGKH